MSKVFTPEKVRELAFQLKYCNSVERESLLTEWLEQNQPEPVVVGLSDEMVKEIAKDITCDSDWDSPYEWKLEQIIKSCLKHHGNEIKHPVVVGLSDEQVNDLSFVMWHNYNQTIAEYQPEKIILKSWLKTQTFTQPQSLPQVEVGQVWKDESTTVKVGCLGRVSKNGDESIAFVDIDTNELKTWMLKTFIAKFERVSG